MATSSISTKMELFTLAGALQILYTVFGLYAWMYDPWLVRDFEPPVGADFVRGLLTSTFPHLMIGAFSFFQRTPMFCMIYLAYVSIELAMQLYLEWFPYLFGIVTGQRLFKMVTELGQADRILGQLPFGPKRYVPTSEATYRLVFLILITVISSTAVLSSPKIQRKHGNMLLFWCAIFFAIPLLQYWTSGANDTGLLVSPAYTMIYGLLVYGIIHLKTAKQKTSEKKEKQD